MVEHISCHLCGSSDATVLCTRARWGERMRNVVCRRCGLVYANPRLAREALGRFYRERIYPQFVDGQGRFQNRLLDASRRQAEDTFNYFAGEAGITLGGREVLEIGCGLGDFLVRARAEGARVLGVEMDGLYADHAERVHGLPICRGLVENMAFDRQFDAIAMFHVLEHLENPASLLLALRSHVKPGGLLLIEVPDFMGPWRMLPAEFFRQEHLTNFSFETLRETLRQGGFEVRARGRHPYFLRVGAVPSAKTTQAANLQSLAGHYQSVRRHFLRWRIRARLFQPYYALRRLITPDPS